MPYWIAETLAGTPAFLWVYVGLGIPWALALLPRKDWPDWPLTLASAFALGPMLLTAWMFVLGSFQTPLLTRASVLAGTAVLFVVGAFLAARKWESIPAQPQSRLQGDERLLVGLIVAAVIVRWIVVAYWPFTAYDALWVYGYQGRLYFLEGTIPNHIDYYPQFLSLQFTYAQLWVGQISDSAARAVLPFLHVGSILAAYSLGNRLFNRRTGLFLAGVWALWPQVGAWSRMGDLEIAQAFLITLTATFFFMAWNHQPPRRHYAVLAGVVYGTALWTKPTAGAFALGVTLITALELLRLRFDWQRWWPRFETALITGIACVPLGGVWYLRNILLGHEAITFPSSFWYTLAERGGGQLLWPLAATFVLLAYLMTRKNHPDARWTLCGAALLLVGTVPSLLARFLPTPDGFLLALYPSLDGLPRMGVFEWALTVIGGGIIATMLWRHSRSHLDDSALLIARRTAWILILVIPYFALYFWRYSYHYRLSFAILPLLMLPIAVILARWIPSQRLAFSLAVFLLALPGIVVPLHDRNLGWTWLWRGELADDVAKYQSGNDALMWMVNGFEIYEQENGVPPVVSAPGVQRLPFFFPQADIRVERTPTQLDQLADVTYFVDSHPDGTGAYENIPMAENQVLSALGRDDILRLAWGRDDGIFRYEIYELHLRNRFERPQPVNEADGTVLVGDVARFLGHDISSSTFQIGERRTMKLMWEVLGEADADYMTYIHLRDTTDNLHMAWDGPVGLSDNERYYYTTLVWEPGEFIVDERGMRLTNEDTPPGEGFQLVIGMYDLVTQERLPVTINGETVGDGYRLDEDITVIPR